MIQYPITRATAVASFRACLEGGYTYTARNIWLDVHESANVAPTVWGPIRDDVRLVALQFGW